MTPGESTGTSETSSTGDTTGPDPTSTSSSTGDATTGDGTTGDPTTGDATGDATTGDATTDATTGGPACLDLYLYLGPRDGLGPDFTCGLPELCPGPKPLFFTLSDPPESGDVFATTDDVERARCMVAALRDRKPGHINYEASFAGKIGSYLLRDEVLGESGARRLIDTNDFITERYESVKLLREPAFFDACLRKATADAQWSCLWDAYTEECVLAPLVCR